MTSICVFGMQTGGELLSRVRYQEGDVVPERVSKYVSELNVADTVRLLAGALPQYRFVDVMPSRLTQPEPIQGTGTFTADFVSLVQPASYVTVTLGVDDMNRFIADMYQSGLYELLTIKEM